MTDETIKTRFLFVVDTDRYAGNFERELVAYMTGAVGECGVGEEYAEQVPQSIHKLFSWNLDAQPDDSGCLHSSTLVATTGWHNDGWGNHYRNAPGQEPTPPYPAYLSVGIYFLKKPDESSTEILRNRAKDFFGAYQATKVVTILGFRLIEVTETVRNKELTVWR